jgi:predicted polyphosphate/ATP-dependent NAD kinase
MARPKATDGSATPRPDGSTPALAGRIGFVINPVAGMGGRVGLMGTDGAERLRQAIQLGARPTSTARADVALSELAALAPGCTIVTAPGALGAELATERGFACEIVEVALGPGLTAQHTMAAAVAIARREVELLLFAGGDGTARDLLAALGDRLPVLGIPSGVKMHSGVFAASPRQAGRLAAETLTGAWAMSQVRAEVVDREERSDGGYGPVRFYGQLRVPGRSRHLLTAKAAGPGADVAVRAMQRAIVEEMEPGRLYILGPGATVGGVRAELGLSPRTLAVGVVRDQELVTDDATETDLLSLLDADTPATVIVGVIGGQGSLLGRGNLPLSPSVLRRVGIDNLMIVASLDKLAALRPPCLHVDTGDRDLDHALSGFRPVRVAPHRTVLLEVTC